MDNRERERVGGMSGMSTEAAILLIVLLLIFLSMVMLTVMCCKMSSVEWQLRRLVVAPTPAPLPRPPAFPVPSAPTEYYYPY